MLTLVLLILPLFASILSFAVQSKPAKYIALVATIIELVLSIVMVPQLNEIYLSFINFDWNPSLGIQFYLGLDSVGWSMVMLTNLVAFFVVLSSFDNGKYGDNATFFGLVLLMQSALIGVFAALDCFLFYIFWELALIPIYFISGIWGGQDRIKVTLKFFIYTVFGSLFMLAGIVFAYLQTPEPHSFDIYSLRQIGLEGAQELFVFIMFFLAFAIKMPIFPFHSWQPETYTQAPAAGTMLLSGIMLKMGIYGIIRWIFPITPEAFSTYGFWIILLSVTGILYASIIAIKQKHAKRLVAFSSIAHVGLIVAGLSTLTLTGMQGAIIQMINHGINVVGIFFVLEIIERRTQTLDIEKLGGIVHKAPVLAVFFVIILLGNVALPLTNGFVGEFLLLKSVFDYNVLIGAFAASTVILGAVYMLRMYNGIMLGPSNERTEIFQDVSWSEFLVLATICILIIGIGVYPAPLLKLTEQSYLGFMDLFKTASLSIK